MSKEYVKRLKHLDLDEETFKSVQKILEEAAKEFPCLSCPSKSECANFKWYTKWYGEQE